MENPGISEELELLRRILREELFRFVLVEYNHTDAIKQAEQFVRKAYPRRSILELRIQDNHFRNFSKQLKDFKRGIVFIPDFDAFFKTGYEDFAIAFNQRRDWMALQPLALVCFVPAGGLPKVMEGMPDFWSRRDAELSLLIDLPERSGLVMQEAHISTIGGTNASEKTAELQRLRAEIAAADPNNFSQLDNLYRQLLPLLEDIGDYRGGLEAAHQYYHLANLHHDAINDSDSLSFAYERQARFHMLLGQYTDALYHFNKALELVKQYGDDNELSKTQNNLALVLKDLGNYAEARLLLEKAVVYYEKNLGPDHPTTAVSYSNLATVLQALGDYVGAKQLLEKAVVYYEKNLGPDHPTTAVSYSNLALVLQDLGNYAKAKLLLEKAMASDEKNFGPDHPTTAVRYSNLATVLKDLGDYAKAKLLLEKAMASDEKNFGPDHPNTTVRYSNLALVLQDLGDYAGAKELLEKAMASDEKNLGPDHPTTAVSYSNLALVLQDLGDYAGAKELLEKAIVSGEKNFGTKHLTTATFYNNLASNYQEQKQWQQAAMYYQKAYNNVLKIFGKNHPHTKDAKESLTFVQSQLSKTTLSSSTLRKKRKKPRLKK